MKDNKTRVVNGEIQVGDLVISTPDDDFPCLIGRVTGISLAGTAEHKQVTANKEDAVHVNFLEYEYHPARVLEIEAVYSELFGQKKVFGECPLGEVIMTPGCLMHITDIDETILKYLLESGFNAACYCYKILSEHLIQVI